MTVISSNAFQIAAEIRTIGFRHQIKLVATTRAFTALLRTEIIRNASTGHHKPGLPHIPGTGPGPNWATGDYRRSWGTRVDVGPTSVIGEAFTNSPQAHALESGAVIQHGNGGRTHIPPYPHAGPALEKVGAAYVAAVTAELDDVLR